MAKISYCGICGKMLHGIERNCAYCGILMCKDHNINGLCPQHAHTMDHNQVRAINRQRNVQTWICICGCPVILFSLFFGILGFIYVNDLVLPIVSMSIFGVVLIATIVIFRRAQSSKSEVYSDVDENLGFQPLRNCPSCGKNIPRGRTVCVFCGAMIQQPQAQPQQTLPSFYQQQPPPPPQPVENQQQQYTPPPPSDYTPNPDINRGLQEIIDANPGAKIEKIEIIGFYDSKTQSGFHICRHCNKRFDTDGTLTRCPYCNGSIYGESTDYR